MRNTQHQQTLLGEGRLAADDLMMQYLHCQRAMASWIPISRSNSFLKNVHRFTVGGNLLNFPWFLPWNPKESAHDVQYLNRNIWPCSSHCCLTIIFLTFLTHQKLKKITGCLSKSPSLPPKKLGQFFSPKAHLEHHLSDFASAPPCSAPVPLPLESKVVVAPTLRPDVGPRAGRRWGGMWTGTCVFFT